jgi:predicted  nucleic acid-binding Zn-ribbon protein
MIKFTETDMDIERIAKLETKVDIIQEDIKEVRDDIKEVHSRITTQTREIVEKIDDFQTRIEHKMQAGALAATEQHNSIKDDVLKEIKEVKTTLDKDIQEVTKRVDVLENWRWMIVGGALVAGYIIGHLEIFSKLFGK